jgi:uncharacterized membrane protein
MSTPRSFAVAAFPTKEEAERALDALDELVRAKAVELEDAAIVVKTDAEKVELHQRKGLSVGGGAVGGGTIGLVAGLVLGFPIAGALLGLAAGGGIGALDRGIDDGRMKELGRKLDPGQAALCVLVGKVDWALLRERLGPLGGELLAAELTPEAEAEIAAAATREGVQKRS